MKLREMLNTGLEIKGRTTINKAIDIAEDGTIWDSECIYDNDHYHDNNFPEEALDMEVVHISPTFTYDSVGGYDDVPGLYILGK